MSRIGQAQINIPAAATVEFKDKVVTVKGNNITMTRELNEGFDVKIEDGVLTVVRPDDAKSNKALHGLYRALINNMIIGTTEGFKKQLELVGVGYRATNQGQRLDLSLGFSHNIVLELPEEIKVETLTENQKPISGKWNRKMGGNRKRIEPFNRLERFEIIN